MPIMIFPIARYISFISPALIVAAVVGAGEARAANGAYSVDAADINGVGDCKVESWFSSARNTDFSAVSNPSCVVDLGRPVELDMLANYARSSDDVNLSFTPKAKINLIPTGIGKFGVSFYATGTIDAATGNNTAISAVIPVTYRLSETMRFNFNGGWLWDRTLDKHYLTYGIGYDWKFTDVLQLTVEAFGITGAPADMPSTTRPRFQAGVRYRPDDIFSIDVIYGHNITGENSNWITIGTTYRFPAPESKASPSGHL